MANDHAKWSDDQLVEASHRNDLHPANVEMMRRLKTSIGTLDQNLSRLLSAIHTLDRRLLLFTIAIFIFTVVQVGLIVYQIFFQKP